MKCLVVDDSNVTLFVTQNILEKLNLDVISAKTIQEANEHINNNAIDFIITDIHLEKENASDFIKSVKDNGTSQMPIIVLTGVDDQKQKDAIMQLGADDYLLKPTTLDKIRVSLDKLGII